MEGREALEGGVRKAERGERGRFRGERHGRGMGEDDLRMRIERRKR